MTVQIARTDLTARELRVAAKIKDARACRRILAIGLVLEGVDRKLAAQSCGMDRQTLRDWVHRYNAKGLPGLLNRRVSGPSCLLSPAQKEELAQWVRNGPDPAKDGVVRWRRVDLKRRIGERLGVVMHECTVGKQLARLGFRRLSTCPQHPKSDPEAQDRLKNFAAKAGGALPEAVRGRPPMIVTKFGSRMKPGSANKAS